MSEENQEPQTILEDAVKRVRQLQKEADTARQATDIAAMARRMVKEAMQKKSEKEPLENFGMDRPVANDPLQEHLLYS